ncbi:hypothetical protein Z043_113786 [Scleropages formosus]|uniref:Uncharacterized protein n=1 Tax=Scleropages formosus TaxID=113540 RepID=A0A0P7WZV8_SCLFO|nr:hypothetical protein Z043_113786 [Scleropages formosus]
MKPGSPHFGAGGETSRNFDFMLEGWQLNQPSWWGLFLLQILVKAMLRKRSFSNPFECPSRREERSMSAPGNLLMDRRLFRSSLKLHPSLRGWGQRASLGVDYLLLIPPVVPFYVSSRASPCGKHHVISSSSLITFISPTRQSHKAPFYVFGEAVVTDDEKWTDVESVPYFLTILFGAAGINVLASESLSVFRAAQPARRTPRAWRTFPPMVSVKRGTPLGSDGNPNALAGRKLLFQALGGRFGYGSTPARLRSLSASRLPRGLSAGYCAETEQCLTRGTCDRSSSTLVQHASWECLTVSAASETTEEMSGTWYGLAQELFCFLKSSKFSEQEQQQHLRWQDGLDQILGTGSPAVFFEVEHGK